MNRPAAEHIFFDGSGGSPRGSSCAAVMFDRESGEIIDTRTKLLDGLQSNNIAEYSGLILALELALDHELEEVIIFSDSQLVVNQVRGKWDVKNADLARLRDEAWALGRAFNWVSLNWVPRERNREADALCTQTLDAHCPRERPSRNVKKQKKQDRKKKPNPFRPSQ